MANGQQFSAKVSDWVAQSQRRLEAVFRASVQEVVSRAQQRIPIDTGFAKASVRASLSKMPSVTGETPQEGKRYSYDSSGITLVIKNAKLGDVIYIGWTANYAIFLEYGHSQQAPTGFLGVTALEWPRIVSEQSAKLKARVTNG